MENVIFSDAFSATGEFSYRMVHPSAPERTENWAIKITQFPNDKLLMVWCSTCGGGFDPTNRLWTSSSTDDGVTWSEPAIFAETTAEGSVLNPCCYTHGDGRAFIFYNVVSEINDNQFRFRVACQTSTDMGATWSNRQYIDTGADAVGLMSSAICLRSGTILLPIYFESSADHWVGSVLLSEDGGNTWQRGGNFDVNARRGATEPAIVQLGDDSLYCLIRTTTGYQYECRSQDGGLAWTQPTQSIFASPEANGILRSLSGGNLAFAWNNNNISNGSMKPRYPLYVAMSEDDSGSWPYGKMIETTYGSKQLTTHDLFQTAAGTILVPTDHYQGTWDGAQHGRIELARFDEEWIRSQLSKQKWVERPAPTGGIRLDPNKVLLVAGANNGDMTLLESRFRLPGECVVEYTITDTVKDPNSYNGLYIGAQPFDEQQAWFYFARTRMNSTTPAIYARGSELSPEAIQLARNCYYDSTTVTLTLSNGQIRYEDSDGVTSVWLPLPGEPGELLSWGFFSRNTGVQGRMTVRDLKITTAGFAPGDANCDGTVNDADAAIIAANWLSEDTGWYGGDFNNDGIVNDIDATLLACNWQQTGNTGSAIPELKMIYLLLMPFALLIMRKLQQ